MNTQERVECVRLLTNLKLPLVRINQKKIAPKTSGGKYRRMPLERWTGETSTERPAESFHDCCVAVKTGSDLPDGRKLYILDIDLKKKEGREEWERIVSKYGDPEFWAGPISRTESGGLHLWFAAEDTFGVQLGILPGIDFLGLGALSFEPPSRFLENGTLLPYYVWETPPTNAEEIPSIPQWLRNELEIREIKSKSFKEMREKNDFKYAMGISENGLQFIEQCFQRYTPSEGLQYDHWLRLAMALHEATNGSDAALSIFDTWGARVAADKGGNYDEKKTRITWDSFGSRAIRVGFGTLIRTFCDDQNITGYMEELTEEFRKFFSGVALEPDSTATSKNTNDTVESGERGKVINHLSMPNLILNVAIALFGDNVGEFKTRLRTNETNGAIEVTLPNEDTRRLDQPTEDRIVLQCRDQGVSKGLKPLQKEADVLRAVNIMADQNKYHPIRDYLTKCLAEYKKQTLINDVTTGANDKKFYRKKFFRGVNLVEDPEGDAKWFRVALNYWLRGAVCKVFYEYQNRMIVLQGKQGIGKSTLAKSLVKKIGTPYFYAGAIDPNDKDHKLKLAQLFLWEPDELGGTTANADINRLKSMLTLTRINERPPYGKHVVDMSVVCSFMGTVNDQSFLRDATGSRRFLVCRFDPADCSKTIEFLRGVDFDPDMLWGEVYSELLDENCRAPFLEVLDSQEAEVRAGEVRQISDLESLLEDLIEVQLPRSQYDVRWLLPRKDLRVALEESGMTLGKNVVQKAAEWIATVTKAKSITDCMSVSQGERVFKGVRLRTRIVVPPTMPKKT